MLVQGLTLLYVFCFSFPQDGDTQLSFTEDVLKRFEAYGWHTQTVSDVVTDLDALRQAIHTAKGVTDKPSIIKVKTKIGQGSPSKEGHHSAHGAPLGADDLASAKKAWGLPPDESFYVPPEVQAFWDSTKGKGEEARAQWETMFTKYAAKFPEKAQEISRRFAHKLPEGILDKLPTFAIGKDKDQATRKFSQGCLEAIAPSMPELIGGSADLTPSNLTNYTGAKDFQKDTPEGRYLRFGIREHAMVAISNGMFAHGGLRPYCATFLVFFGYCAGAVRVAALSKFGIIFIMTHDSIGLGEDGPTHQPIETLESLRSMPNVNVYRPADAHETSGAYQVALQCTTTPTVICCSRSGLPAIPTSTKEKAVLGAYAAMEEANPDLILVATGSEVGPSMKAAEELVASGIKTRVVSMPCQEVFLQQSTDYQTSILPGTVPTLSIEASSVHGWHRFAHAQIGMDTFGASGGGSALFQHFGFTAENIATKGKALVEFYQKAGTVPNLNLRPVFTTNGTPH
jgi:transketolase